MSILLPVNQGAYGRVNRQVSASGVALLEPRSDRGVRDDIVRGGKLRAKLLRKGDEPVNCSRSATVERVEVLVVDLKAHIRIGSRCDEKI